MWKEPPITVQAPGTKIHILITSIIIKINVESKLYNKWDL